MIEQGGILGVKKQNKINPQEISIGQNYPNPFNPETVIQYTLSKDEQVSLKVFDISGKEITTLFEGRKGAGTHFEKWEGYGSEKQRVSSGLYFYQLRAGENHVTKKMVFAK